MNLRPSSRQRKLIALARGLARERFAPRAERHDREASFPFDDYADLRSEGLLGLCVPEPYGGLGADFETYCLVAEQIAQGNASTALTFNMHCLTMMMIGPIADDMAMAPTARERHEKLRAAKYREVVEDGVFYGQPHSEPVEHGQTDTSLAVGGRRFWHHRAKGRWRLCGQRAEILRLIGRRRPVLRHPGDPARRRAVDRAHAVFEIPKDAPGVRFSDDWDPMGMRARSAVTWCWKTHSSPTRLRCCRRASSGRCTTPSRISS